MNESIDPRAISRAVMEDRRRPCLFGVAGPCSHPKCLDAHYATRKEQALKERDK